jgi:hypothetical protein
MLDQSADYALIMHGAIYHVALKLEGAAPAALSFSDLVRDYSHPNPSDLARVKRHEHIESDWMARLWIIRRAVSMLEGLTVDGDMVSFAPGNGFDDLTWAEGKIGRPQAEPALRDAFSQIDGAFADGIRDGLGDLSELRESMQAWGWIPEFPALVDERGVILAGHRRMAVAKELGIAPVVTELRLGFGDPGDAARFKLAIASNIGGRKLGPSDRKRLATYLYSDPEWSQPKLTAALSAARERPLAEPPPPVKVKRRPYAKHAILDKVSDPIMAELDVKVHALIEEGLPRPDIAKRLGIGEHIVQLATQRYVGRMQERNTVHACPQCGHMHGGSHAQEI